MNHPARRTISLRARAALRCAAPAAVIGAVLLFAGPAAAIDDPPSTLTGRQLSVDEVIATAHAAGFRSETQLVSVTSVAIAESSLWSRTRNWQPQHGYRPASDRIGVEGPRAAWNASHTQQLNSDRGLWQVSSRWWPQYGDAQLDDPAQAARIVYSMSSGGTKFGAWDSFASGTAQRTWDRAYDGWPAVRPLVKRFLASRGSAPSPVAARTHTVQAGDTLYRLAARYYGDGRLWPRIADANAIGGSSSISAGQVLVIP